MTLFIGSQRRSTYSPIIIIIKKMLADKIKKTILFENEVAKVAGL